MILLTSVLCVVLSLEFGVATPKGNRFRQSHIQNEVNNEFNVVQNTGEPTNPYNTPNNENELLYQKNPKNVFMNNEDYEKMYASNNPAAFRNVKKEQRSVISESKEYNRNTGERNFNDFKEPSYIASLPQVNRMQSFRPNDEVNNEANKETRIADILSEVNNPNTDTAPIESNAPIQKGNKSVNTIMNKYNRANSQPLENFNDKYEEEDSTLSDVPVATPEYIKSLYDQPTNRNSPKNVISNKNLQPNSQNANEATFQNPSAEILYETGRAKPYEISNEPSNNSRQGQTNTRNILRDKQKLKNLYLSSKPTKNYMIVYPDGRVEQVDHLDKIQKAHPNYVMLNAKELLQHGKQNTKYIGSQGSVVNQYTSTTTNTNTKPQLNSIKNSKYEQIEKEPQILEEQTLPAPNELPAASESCIISTTEVTEINNVVRSSEDQLKESGFSESQEKDKFNNNDNTNSETIVTTSDNSSNQVSSTSTSEIPDNEDIVTTARSTVSTPTTDMVVLNQNSSYPVSTSNNTDNPNLPKQPEDSNRSGGNLVNTKDDSVPAVENTTPTPKQESKEDESTNNTTTVNPDLNAIKENSVTTDRIETIDVNNGTYTNSSSVDSSVNKVEGNSTTTSDNETVITSKDVTDSDGNTNHIETIITKSTNESSVQNLESNNATSSDSSTVVTNSNTTEIKNSSNENTENDMKPINVTPNPLTKNTSELPEEKQNNNDTTTIKQTVSNVTNSEVNETKNDDSNPKQDGAKNTDDGTGGAVSSKEEDSPAPATTSNDNDSPAPATASNNNDSPARATALNDNDSPAPATTSNDNNSPAPATASNDNDSPAPATTSNDNDSPQKVLNEDDEDYKENLDTDSPNSDENVKESPIWFNATDSFWKNLMNNEHNTFYFLFPRPQPNTKETKKIMYPNGTVVIETTETIDNGDGEPNSTKTVVTCGNCTKCDKN